MVDVLPENNNLLTNSHGLYILMRKQKCRGSCPSMAAHLACKVLGLLAMQPGPLELIRDVCMVAGIALQAMACKHSHSRGMMAAPSGADSWPALQDLLQKKLLLQGAQPAGNPAH